MAFWNRLRIALRDRRVAAVVLGTAALALTGLGYFVWIPAWNGHVIWRQAEEALDAGDLDRACECLRQYVTINPRHAEGHFLLARTLRRNGQYADAERELASAHDWIPEMVLLEEILLEVEQAGTNGDAGKVLQRFLAAGHPDANLILEAMAQGDRRAINLGQALHWLDRWIDRDSHNWRARFWRGELRQAFAYRGPARDDFLKVLEMKPDHLEAHLKLGQLALETGDYAEAQEHTGRFLEQYPDFADALLTLAAAHRGQGDDTQAAVIARRILKQEPTNGDAALLLGTIEAQDDRPETALIWLRQGEQHGGDPQNVQYQLAQVLRRLGKTEDADCHQRRFEESKKEGRALEDAVRAALKDPANAELRYDVGRLHTVLGKDRQAEQWFLGTLQLDPNHRASHQALAELYARRTDSGAAPLAKKQDRPGHAPNPIRAPHP